MIDGNELGHTGPAYVAGAVAPAGRYVRIDSHGREIVLTATGPLPPSFDGRVAIYTPIRRQEVGL